MADTLRRMKPEEVRVIREKLHLTQQQLADLIGVRRNTISRWETGAMNIKHPAALLLERLVAEAKEQAHGEN